MSDTPDVTPASEAEPTHATAQTTFAIWLGSLAEKPFVQRLTGFYEQHERYVPALFFFAGVGWDTATLTRIDKLFDNIFLLTYLVLLGGLIVVATVVEQGRWQHPVLVKYQKWYPAAIQFLLGALFSAYVIYYSHSASFTETSLFLVLLVVLLVANELIHKRLLNLYLLLGLYFVVCCSFLIFFIPVVTGNMGYGAFLTAGLLALGVVGGILVVFKVQAVLTDRRTLLTALGVVLGLFGVFNLFYWNNWIPPVPLAMRFGGIYHEVTPPRTAGQTGYTLRYEKPAWYQFWVRDDGQFRFVPGDAVYCFAAIFAPANFETEVVYEWRYYDPAQRQWVVTDRIQNQIKGGRNGGFRDFTRKRNLQQAGEWAVEVQTLDGRTIGRIEFDLTFVEPSERVWTTKAYE